MVYQGRKTESTALTFSSILFREALIHTLEEALIISPQQIWAAVATYFSTCSSRIWENNPYRGFREKVPGSCWLVFSRPYRYTTSSVLKDTHHYFLCQAFPDLKQVLHASFLQDLVSALQSRSQSQCKRVLNSYTIALEQYISHPFILCPSATTMKCMKTMLSRLY